MSVFQSLPPDRILYKNDHFFIVEDAFPVSPGHMLVISNEPRKDFFDLTQEEKKALSDTIEIARQMIEKKHQPDGYNIGMNCGEAAGQTVMHFHCHVIPRFTGDMKNPRGGIRHCVEGKGYY